MIVGVHELGGSEKREQLGVRYRRPGSYKRLMLSLWGPPAVYLGPSLIVSL